MRRLRSARTWACSLAGLLATLPTLPLGGCAASVPAECDRTGRAWAWRQPQVDRGVRAPRAHFGEFEALPRPRMGALPFPGMMTLYTSADGDLGEHSYAGPGASEVDRGIVYTCDGGFLDVSHIRNAADMTGYLHARLAHALRSGWGCLRFRGKEPSLYECALTYPEGWDDMDPAERDAVIEEAAVITAQRLALTVMTWHELLTWYGYKSAVVVSERGSAFTYDDGPSHMVGVLVAGEVLREGIDFDTGVTDVLGAVLEELGVVEPSRLHEAAMAVEGDWWAFGQPRRRLLHTGLEARSASGPAVVRPWLVPDLEFCDGARPVTLEAPCLSEVLGHDLRGLIKVEIDPRVLESPKVFALLPDATNRVDPDRDFPLLIDDIRREVGEGYTRIEQREDDAVAAKSER